MFYPAQTLVFLRFSGKRRQARGERGARVTRDRRGAFASSGRASLGLASTRLKNAKT